MNDCYITASGRFLPGDPVDNRAMIRHIGAIDEQSAKLGQFVLRQNKIRRRHYALSANGDVMHSNAAMAGLAVRDALGKSTAALADIELLATATTQGDLLVPGHASAVHGELNGTALEIASFQSVCASSLMAAKSAYLHVVAGDKSCAAVTGSEFSSRWFRPGFYQPAKEKLDDAKTRMSAEFLRWTLSDGAGALILEPEPAPQGLSLKIDWIDVTSLAHRYDLCMYAGTTAAQRDQLEESWSHHPSPAAAAAEGAIMLLQDFDLLKRMIRGWIGEYLKRVDAGRILPKDVDWLLCHYSADCLRQEIVTLLEATHGMVPQERWFSNLPTRGNTGAAAVFIMIDEFLEQGLAKPGDKILCVVPESGRGIIGFMMLTAV